jgi:hypothetical protein
VLADVYADRRDRLTFSPRASSRERRAVSGGRPLAPAYDGLCALLSTHVLRGLKLPSPHERWYQLPSPRDDVAGTVPPDDLRVSTNYTSSSHGVHGDG